MPSVYLRGRCSRPEDLPDVCLRCGAPTTNRVKRTFTWAPPWIIVTIFFAVLVYLILASVLQKSYTVSVPLCEQHRRHWTWRLLLILGSFLPMLGGGIGLAVLFISLGEQGGAAEKDTFGPLACLSVIGGIVGWFILIVVANMTAIRAREITDDGIRLGGACQEFVEAYHDLEDREREARRGAAGRWREEDDRPRRREGGDQYQPDEDDRRRRERGDDY